MKTLDILVPQYKETDEDLKTLFDSIAIQQNISFKNLQVIVTNDGSDVKLSEEFLKGYPFKIKYLQKEHEGVSSARNYCLDNSKADYVMFCDADDMFFNACGLFIIFQEMEKEEGFDTLVSAFLEESRMPDKTVIYHVHQIDQTFVHGKVHRRQYLIDNNIRWNDSLQIHEDSYFNCLCQKLTENGKYCPTPFYLWKWRDESVCRHDPLYLNKTLIDMFKSNTALVNQFLERDKKDLAIEFASSMIYDTYYSLNCDRWWNEGGHPFLQTTEQRFKKYWNDFKYLFYQLDEAKRLPIIASIKNRFFYEGLALERITFDDWIKRIESLTELDDDQAKEEVKGITLKLLKVR